MQCDAMRCNAMQCNAVIMTKRDLKAICIASHSHCKETFLYFFLGYYFIVWLMLMEFSFTTTFLDSQKAEYQVIADDVMFEVTYAWASTTS